MEPVMPMAINHQSGVFISGTPAIRSVIHAIERLFSTSGGRGMRSSKGTIFRVETCVSAIMRFLRLVQKFASVHARLGFLQRRDSAPAHSLRVQRLSSRF